MPRSLIIGIDLDRHYLFRALAQLQSHDKLVLVEESNPQRVSLIEVVPAEIRQLSFDVLKDIRSRGQFLEPLPEDVRQEPFYIGLRKYQKRRTYQ